MAANKFATMLHRKTNKMTLILVYALLEWILIILLLLNSLFSYLITKFADYFGLKTPCLWCSRVDHIFEPGKKKKNSPREFICEVHAAEISKLGYCSNHRKLAESQDMCEDCSSSRPERRRVSKNLAFFPWVKDFGMIQSEGEKKVDENGEEVGLLQCSCCAVILDSKIYSPYIVIKPSWGVLDYTQNGNLIAETHDGDDDDDDQIEEGDASDRSRSDFVIREGDEAEMDCSVSVANSGLRDLDLGGHEDEEQGLILGPMREEPIKEDESNSIVEDASVEILPPPQHHLEFFVGHGGHRLIPVELIDSTTEENQINYRIRENSDEDCDDHEANLGSVELIVENKSSLGEAEGEFRAIEILEDPKFAVLESMEIEENENSLIFHPRECDLVREIYEHADPQTTSEDVHNGQQILAEERDSDVPAGN